VITKSKLSW